jgi:hypothetical protein
MPPVYLLQTHARRAAGEPDQRQYEPGDNRQCQHLLERVANQWLQRDSGSTNTKYTQVTAAGPATAACRQPQR